MSLSDETTESTLTCSKCKTPVLYRRIEGEENTWGLEVPCVKCGSWIFDVIVENPRMHCQIFGVNA